MSERCRGFTLVELIIVLVILGVLAMVAVPRFLNMAAHVRRDACKSALAEVRAAISEHHRRASTPAPAMVSGEWTASPVAAMAVAEGEPSHGAKYPTLSQLTSRVLPDNPYSTATETRNRVLLGVQKGRVVTPGTSGAWAYDPATGDFWADTESGAGEAGF